MHYIYLSQIYIIGIDYTIYVQDHSYSTNECVPDNQMHDQEIMLTFRDPK